MMNIEEYINFHDQKLIEAIYASILCFALWIVLPHLEFKYKLLTRLAGGDEGRACDFLAYFLIYTGTSRNHYINEAINYNKQISYGMFEYPMIALCVASMVVGLVLVATSFYRLGLRGMYFGDHFGFLFKEKITQFPYNYFENPQYVGTSAFFIGYSLYFHSPTGVLLTVLMNCLYHLLNVVEERKLKIFYPLKKNSGNDLKSS
jgi:phosphatidylethanolamine N-methyltransferase